MELVSTNLDTVRKIYQDFADGNIPAIIECLHDEAMFQYNAPPVVPIAGNFEGKQGILHFYQLIGENAEMLLFEAHEFIEAGDKIVIEGRESARSKKTGKTFDSRYIHIAELEDGKLRRLRCQPDTAALAAAFTE